MSDLHFIRVRQKDSNDPFVDPEADIRVILQKAVLDSANCLKLVDADNADYLLKVFAVMYTRLAEDKSKLTEQFKAFMQALNKAPSGMLHAFMENVGWWCLISYMLFSRRDSKIDARDRKKISASSAYLYLSELLAAETKSRVEEELKEYLDEALKTAQIDCQVDAVCTETGERIQDIQNLVSNMFSAGSMTWTEAANACDKYFNEVDDENIQIAAALAYPDYKQAIFTVTKTEGDTEDGRDNGDNGSDHNNGEQSPEQADASTSEV